jgi:hypothetical protein
MDREDDRRRRHRDERRRSRSRSRTRTKPSTNSKKTQEPRSTRDTDDRQHRTSAAPESSRQRGTGKITITEPGGNRYELGNLTYANLAKLPGKKPEPVTGKGSMAGSKSHEVAPVDCMLVKSKPRPDSSGDTRTDRPRRIMPAQEEPITTLVHRPARRDSSSSRAESPEQSKSLWKSHRPSEGDKSRPKGSRLPEDTRSSRRDHRSSIRRDESRSPTPPPTSPELSSRHGHPGDFSLDLYNVGPPPPLVDPYRDSRPTNVPPGTYPPISRGGTNPMSPRHYTDPSQLRALADQPYTQPYAGTYTGHGTRGAPRTTHGPNYTGVFAVDGSECFAFSVAS